MSVYLHAGATITARDLEDIETIEQGHCCNLKLQDRTTRVWLCRVAGGVTIEALIAGSWVTIAGDDYASEATIPGGGR